MSSFEMSSRKTRAKMDPADVERGFCRLSDVTYRPGNGEPNLTVKQCRYRIGKGIKSHTCGVADIRDPSNVGGFHHAGRIDCIVDRGMHMARALMEDTTTHTSGTAKESAWRALLDEMNGWLGGLRVTVNVDRGRTEPAVSRRYRVKFKREQQRTKRETRRAVLAEIRELRSDLRKLRLDPSRFDTPAGIAYQVHLKNQLKAANRRKRPHRDQRKKKETALRADTERAFRKHRSETIRTSKITRSYLAGLDDSESVLERLRREPTTATTKGKKLRKTTKTKRQPKKK